MYKIVNGLLPEIMSESCIVNNEVHDQFTRQSHLLQGKNHISIQRFRALVHEFGIPYKTKLTFLFPLLNLKEHPNFFPIMHTRISLPKIGLDTLTDNNDFIFATILCYHFFASCIL